MSTTNYCKSKSSGVFWCFAWCSQTLGNLNMKRIIHTYYQLLKVLTGTLMGVLIIPVTMQIVSRYTGIIPQYLWTEELALFLFIWIVMLGSMIAVYEGTHFEVDLLPRPKSARARAALDLIVNACMIVMALIFLVDGWKYAKFGSIQTSDIMGVNLLIIYCTIPLAGGSWLLFLLEKSCRNIKGIVRPTDDSF